MLCPVNPPDLPKSHTWSRTLVRAILGICALVLLAGCSESKPDAAMDRLARRGYALSIEDFHRAARAGDVESVKGFLEAGMAVDVASAEGMTALGAACEGDATDVVALLLRSGAKVSQPIGSGRTPIMLAAAHGTAPTLRLLIDNGADPRARDSDGWHPLGIAAWNGQADATKSLALRAPAGELDDALLLVCLQGNLELADILLRHGASVRARDANNRSPLMVAASHGHAEVVKRLIENGANRFALHPESGWTPSNFATVAEQEARAEGDEELAKRCHAVALLLADASDAFEETSGVFDDPRDVVTLPPEGADEATSAAISSGRVRLAQPLADATLPAKKPGFVGLKESLKLLEYRERTAPVILNTVDIDGKSARFRPLFGTQSEVLAQPGQTIPGTPWVLLDVQRKIGSGKDDGLPVDLSSATVELRPGGPRRTFVAGTQTLLEEPQAVIQTDPSGQLLSARQGDTFRIANDPASYRIREIGPDSVLMENLDTQEVWSLPRR